MEEETEERSPSAKSVHFANPISTNSYFTVNSTVEAKSCTPHFNPDWTLKTTETITLKPRTETYIPISTEGIREGEHFIIEPLENLYNKNQLLIPRTIISASSTHIPVINPKPTATRLCKHTTLGKRITVQAIRAHNDDSTATEEAFKILNFQEKQEKTRIRKMHEEQFRIADDITPHTREQLLELTYEFNDCFSYGDHDLGKVKNFKFNIDATGEPCIMKGFPMSYKEQETINKTVEDLLARNIVRHSQSPYSTFMFLVKQKDEKGNEKIRPVLQYKALNKQTKHIAFPLPRIDRLLENMREARYITVADVKSAYHQLELTEESKEKTAFSTNKYHVEFNYLPFGLRCAPQGWSKLMTTMLAGIEDTKLAAYLDDLICMSKTEEDHLIYLRELFTRLRKFGMKLKPSKCVFMHREVKLLGMLVSQDGIKIPPEAIDAVQKIRAPTTKRKVMSVVGMFKYFKRFIPS